MRSCKRQKNAPISTAEITYSIPAAHIPIALHSRINKANLPAIKKMTNQEGTMITETIPVRML